MNNKGEGLKTATHPDGTIVTNYWKDGKPDLTKEGTILNAPSVSDSEFLENIEKWVFSHMGLKAMSTFCRMIDKGELIFGPDYTQGKTRLFERWSKYPY